MEKSINAMQNKNTKLNIKNNGEVFTPNFLVNIILEQIDYNKNNANIEISFVFIEQSLSERYFIISSLLFSA